MKRKEIIKGISIFTVTLLAGFLITAVSFNLFNTLTQNQMRLLFAFDVLSLLAIGSFAYLFCESKFKRAQKEKRYQERHSKRVNNRKNEMRDIDLLISKNKFAA